jgi:hypothetical protein
MYKASVYGAKVSQEEISAKNLFNVVVSGGVYTYSVVTDVADTENGDDYKVYVTALYVDSVEATVSPYKVPANPVLPEAVYLAGTAGYAGITKNVLQFTGPVPNTEYL